MLVVERAEIKIKCTLKTSKKVTRKSPTLWAYGRLWACCHNILLRHIQDLSEMYMVVKAILKSRISVKKI